MLDMFRGGGFFFKLSKLMLSPLVIGLAGLFIFGSASISSAEWDYLGYGIKETYVNLVVADPDNNNVIYVATDRFLYLSEDSGQNFKEIFAAPGKESNINFFVPVSGEQPKIFVATEDGIYASLKGRNIWERIYYGSNALENNVNCIALDTKMPGALWIGTDSGISVSLDTGKTWKGKSFGLGTLAVKYVVVEPSVGTIYINANEQIFKSDDEGNTWKNIYSFTKKDVPESVSSEDTAEENEEISGSINSLALNPDKPDEIYAATSRGVLASQSRGKDWQFMTGLGLGNSNIKHVLILNKPLSDVYAANYKGVFKYDPEKSRWIELCGGASFRDAKFLSPGAANSAIWVATGNGVYKTAPMEPGFADSQLEIPEELADKFKDEPSIREVQKAAIRYAEVHPNKIQNWRKEARMKALFPEFDLSYDKTVYVTSNTYNVGPKDWGINLKWDIGDLIFSDDQTNIDVRSRLMVQLRDDILDDVTRLYYERRRLQTEVFASPPKTEKERLDKLLRLQELTAGIDALTGGYFSERIKTLAINER